MAERQVVNAIVLIAVGPQSLSSSNDRAQTSGSRTRARMAGGVS